MPVPDSIWGPSQTQYCINSLCARKFAFTKYILVLKAVFQGINPENDHYQMNFFFIKQSVL